MSSTAEWRNNLPLKITNIVVFLFFFSTGLYSSLSPHGRGKETYFTPAAWTFYVWSLIDLLLLGYVIFQFFDSSKDVVHGVGWRFPLLGILNAIFLHVFVTRHYIVAFIFSIFVASTVSTIYYSLRAHHKPDGVLDAIFVHLPFSLWHAWSIVTVLISAFAAFTHGIGNSHHPGLAVKILVIVSECFLAFTAVGYAFQSRKGDIAGAAVIAWTLWGIYDYQHNVLIHYFGLGAFIVADIAIIKALYFTFARDSGAISLGDEERAPLIG